MARQLVGRRLLMVNSMDNHNLNEGTQGIECCNDDLCSSYVIVGGGIAGLFSALWIKKNTPSANVYIIESQPNFGGLLRSENYQGYDFDYGTHLPRETGDAEIDGLLFDGMNADVWRSFKAIKTGNISYQTHLYPLSQFPTLVQWPKEQLACACYELLQRLSPSKHQYEHLEQRLLAEYGPTLTNNFFRSALQKLMGLDLDQLHPDAHTFFGLQRFILGDDAMMASLKSIPELDARLGFARYDTRVAEQLNFYPKTGAGAGLWVEQLLEKAKAQGVILMPSTQVQQLEQVDGRISGLSVNGCIDVISVSQLVWCAPAIQLMQLLSLKPKNALSKPKLQKSILYHFVFDQDFLVDNCYIYFNSSSFKSFRVTLYPNLAGTNGMPAKCTVEQLVEDEALACTQTDIKAELITAGIVPAAANTLFAQQVLVPGGFPVFTNAFVAASADINAVIEESTRNVCLLGKGSGSTFFMQDVILQAKSKINKFLVG